MLERRRAMMAQAAVKKWSAEEYASGNAPSGAIKLKEIAYPGRSVTGRKAITQITAPNVTEVVTRQIAYNSGLVRVIMQNAVRFGQECIIGNPDLEVIDVKGSGTLMGSLNFFQNAKLSALILRGTEAVCPANNSSLNGSKSSARPLHIYVPAALRAAYEAGGSWAGWVGDGSVVFHDLEGSAYESADWWRDTE